MPPGNRLEKLPGDRVGQYSIRISRQWRISADTALRLARCFGTSARFWINRQARYDLEIEKDRLGGALDDIEPLSAGGLTPTRTISLNSPDLRASVTSAALMAGLVEAGHSQDHQRAVRRRGEQD